MESHTCIQNRIYPTMSAYFIYCIKGICINFNFLKSPVTLILCRVGVNRQVHVWRVSSSTSSSPLVPWSYVEWRLIFFNNYNSLLAQLTPNIGSKATNKQKMNQTHTQTTIIIHKQTKRLFHNITNVIKLIDKYRFEGCPLRRPR